MNEQRFFRFLRERIGLDVESVGAPMVERALRQRCVAAGAMDLDDYWLRLRQSADEQQALIEAVIVPETWFSVTPNPSLRWPAWPINAWLNWLARARCDYSACRVLLARSPIRWPWPCLTPAWRLGHSLSMEWTSAQVQ